MTTCIADCPGTALGSPIPIVELASAPPTRESTPCLTCGSETHEPVVRSAVQMGDPTEAFQWVRCTRCALVFLMPRVREAEVGRYYEDYLPHRGAGAWGKWAPMVERAQGQVDRQRLRTLLQLGALDRRHAVLDAGCGHPTFLRRLHRETGVRSVGTDFDGSGWADAPAEWEGLELHAGILEQLPLRGPFDRITMWHVLEHLYQPLETLRSLRQLVRPGAALIIEVPDHSSLPRRMQGGHWVGYHTPRHTAAYTPATLRRLLEGAGWTVTQQYQRGTLDVYALWWLGRQEQNGRGVTGSLESRFLPFILGRMLAMPVTLLDRWIPLGLQTAIAVA